MSGLIFGTGKGSATVIKDDLIYMLWVQNIWITIICVPYVILIKTKPPSQNEVVVEVQNLEEDKLEKDKPATTGENKTYVREILDGCKNTNYLLLVSVYSL